MPHNRCNTASSEKSANWRRLEPTSIQQAFCQAPPHLGISISCIPLCSSAFHNVRISNSLRGYAAHRAIRKTQDERHLLRVLWCGCSSFRGMHDVTVLQPAHAPLCNGQAGVWKTVPTDNEECGDVENSISISEVHGSAVFILQAGSGC